jgi:hypothetical protein
VEPLAVLGVAYLSYLSAELFHFSGIIRYVSGSDVQPPCALKGKIPFCLDYAFVPAVDGEL